MALQIKTLCEMCSVANLTSIESASKILHFSISFLEYQCFHCNNHDRVLSLANTL